jgi:hypothetical protein
MVKVSGGARTLAGVDRHMAYTRRKGELGLEDDLGNQHDGKGFERDLIEEWDLDIEALKRQTERSIRADRNPRSSCTMSSFPCHRALPPLKVLRAVQTLVFNELQFKHRYATIRRDVVDGWRRVADHLAAAGGWRPRESYPFLRR